MEKDKKQETVLEHGKNRMQDEEMVRINQSRIFDIPPGEKRLSPEYSDDRNFIAYAMLKKLKLRLSENTAKQPLKIDQENCLTAFTDAFYNTVRYYDKRKEASFSTYFYRTFNQCRGQLKQIQDQESNKKTFGKVSKTDRDIISAIGGVLSDLDKDLSILSEQDYSIITDRLNVGRKRKISEKTVRQLLICMITSGGTISIDQSAPDGEHTYVDFIKQEDTEEPEELFEESNDTEVHPVLFMFKLLDLQKQDRRKDYRLIFDKFLMKRLKQYNAHKNPIPEKYDEWTKLQREHMRIYDALADIEEELFGHEYLIKSYLYYVLLPEPDREEVLTSIAQIDISDFREGRKFTNESIADYEGKSRDVIEKRSKEVRKLIVQYLKTLSQERQQ